MTYRQWLKQMKKDHAAAVPDIRDRLPEIPSISTSRIVFLRRATASVVAAAVLMALLGIGSGWVRRDGEQHVPAVSAPSDEHAVPIHTMIKAVTMLHSSTPTPIIDNVNLYVGARLLHATNNSPSEHSDCQGVFYDMEQERFFCADHIMKPALEREGIPTKGVYMHYYHIGYGRIVFTCRNGTRSSYVYDITSDSFTRLPVSLYHCPSVLESLQTPHPYVLLHKMGGGGDDLYLINLLTAELAYILKDSNGKSIYTAMDDSQITEDGKYVHYTLAKGGGDVVNSPLRTTVLYDITTGKSRTFIGEIIEYLSDSQRFFINTPNGCAVYDIVADKIVPYAESELPAYYAYYIKCSDVYTEYDYRFLLCNRLTGEEKSVTEKYVVASVMREQYLYYYIRGEEYLHVFDVLSGGEEYLPLDKDVVQETEGEENKDRSLRFGLQTDEEHAEIWLYYFVTDAPREDAEQIRREQEETPYYSLGLLEEQALFNSIASLEPILRKFPGYVTAYEGDGYLCVDYTGLTTNADGIAVSNRLIALEDYENEMFYILTHQNESYESSFSRSEGVMLLQGIGKSAREMLEELNIPVEKVPRDYRPYLSNDPQVKLQAKLNELSGERVRENNFCYIIHKRNGYTGSRQYLESDADLQELYEFIDFTDSLTYHKLLGYYDEETQNYYRHYTHLMDCLFLELDEYELYIGKKNGKAFLVKNGCLAELTEEQYTKWSAWMDKQEPKCHVD